MNGPSIAIETAFPGPSAVQEVTFPRAEVVAIGNVHPASLVDVAARFGIRKTYADLPRS